ncbi:MAG TPA: 50S ribosomal protein L30 [Tenuifilaceae bacterium]|jgi:large subunit ribosomal protein L30|nr:50S ribosomal protein L30 [Tenuifilaceae bacterium]
MAKITITQVKSRIGSNKRQRATLDTLGLRKINQTVEHEGTPEVLGMVEKVKHLVRVEQ